MLDLLTVILLNMSFGKHEEWSQTPLLPHMQVISEPGAEDALQAQWTGKLVFAEGTDSIKEAVELYVRNETARLQRHAAGWEFAKTHYALKPYIHDYLL